MVRFLGALSFLVVFTSCHLFQVERINSTPEPVERVIGAQFPEGKDAFARTPQSYEATGDHAMISSEGEPATQIALQVLRNGGNAVDAAIALSFAISVYRPHSTGIGGGGFMLIHDPKIGQTEVVDMRERAPAKATKNMYLDKQGEVTDKSRWGALSVATPGLVAGLWETYEKKGSGKIAWKDLVKPSADLARSGFKVDPDLARAVQWVADKGLLKRFPAAAKLLAPAGNPLQEGDLYKNADLADTLDEIAEKGRAGFYSGKVAKEIIRAVQADGGILSQQDLDSYTVKYFEPVKAEFGDYRIVSMPPPSSGGIHVVQMLNMAEAAIRDTPFEDATTLHLKAEIMRRAFADRSQFLGDPAYFKVPVAGLTSEKYARLLVAGIDSSKATKSRDILPGTVSKFEKIHTTHFSIIDKDGLAVSSTQTINYTFGSVLVAGSTGIFLNDEMDDFSAKPGAPNLFGLVGGEANAIAPGKTPLSSMSPTIVLKDGKVVLILGSPGGSRIITSVWNVLFNVLHHQMTLRDAVFAPRIHHQWLPDKLQVEGVGFKSETLDALRRQGHDVEVLEGIQLGSVTAIQIDPKTGKKTGVADPRRGGFAAGY